MEGFTVRIEPVFKRGGELSMKGIGRSITFKWMAFSALLATIPLAIAGINIVQVYQDDLKKSVIDLQKEKASRVADRTKVFLEKATKDLLLIASDRHLKKNPYQTKDYLNHFLSQKDYLIELALLNEKGLETMKVSKFKTEETSDRRDQSSSQMFQVASKGQIFYGNFYYTSDGKETMVVAVPLEKYEGRPVSVLKAMVYLAPLTDLLHQTKISESGSAYVVDKEGFLIAHPDEKNILLGPFVDRVIGGEEGSLEFEDLRRERYLVVYKPIPELKWGVIVQVPKDEAYVPLREIASVAAKWILISLCMAFLISLFFTRRLVRPIKQLSGQMAKVSEGDLDVHIEPSTKDEVGLLTRTFNQMIKDLKKSQEAIKEAEEKYRKIFENSKDMVFITSVDGRFIDINQAGVEMLGYAHQEELMRTPVWDCYFNPKERSRFQEEVAQKGFAKDFEVRLKRKDGTPLDCLITATARRDREGNVVGYEGTIKNISDRKRMEEELFRRTKELQTLYDLSSLINQTLQLDEVLPIALEKVLSLTGFELGAIYLLNEGGDLLEMRYYNGHSPAMVEESKVLKLGEGVSGKAISLKKPIIVSIDEYLSFRKAPALIEEGIKTLVGFPLLAKGREVGTITLLSRSRRDLKPRDLDLLGSIGNQIGIALENAKLFSDVAKAKSEWETTFDTVTDLITIRDKDYRILRANKAAFRRWGMGPGKMIGERCYEILHNFSSPCEGCYVTEVLKTGRPASGERESKYLNGVFQYYTYPIHDESGDIVGVVDLSREITEEKRVRVEKEIINNVHKILASSLDVREVFKAVHSELNTVFDSERMTVVIFNEDGEGFRFFALDKDYEIKELMEGVTYPLKGTPSETAAKTGLPVMILNTEESDYWTSQKLLKEGIYSILVFPLEYKGKIFGTLNFGSKKPNHYSERHLNILQQIAPGMAISIQNALLLDEIRGSEERYRTVVEGALDGVLIVGNDYRFKFVNERLAEMLGYTQKELIGMDFRELLDEESKSLVMDRYVRRQIGEDVPPQYEFKVIRKDGEVRNVEISSSIIKDAGGMIQTIAFLRDITDKKKMEEQLLQSEKLRALGEMASGVAHDFNNALAAILGNTQLLLYTAQDEETRETLKTIEKVARDSAQTVKRLQEFTRKRTQQELFKLDVNSIVKDVIEITKPKWRDEYQKKGIQIDIIFKPEDVPAVSANAPELREVITNILLNAIEAMPEGGRIEIQTFSKDHRVHIQIADTGIGMTEEVKKKIFEPFFTTKPFTNTGLGLSMSYGIIKRFGGEIEVQSRVGAGTTFAILLPVSQEGKEEKETVSDFIYCGDESARILIIDDEEAVRQVLFKMLSKFNHRVTVAKSGEEGLRLFGEDPFDMVLTDLGMPGLSGWDVCKSIKQMKPSTPVGMITGWGLEIDEAKRMEVGLDFIITKPFNVTQVMEAVSETMKQRTSRAS